MLLAHMVFSALRLARANAGSNRLARIAMMAITTSNSIRVKAFFLGVFIAGRSLKGEEMDFVTDKRDRGIVACQ